MRILLDESFPKSAADVCEFGADDEEAFGRAQKLGAVILTSDRDFYHTVPLVHPEHCGIVVVALRQVAAEFECGPYAVSVDLPEMADPATLKASLENGILSVAVAKRSETQARRIEIA